MMSAEQEPNLVSDSQEAPVQSEPVIVQDQNSTKPQRKPFRALNYKPKDWISRGFDDVHIAVIDCLKSTWGELQD